MSTAEQLEWEARQRPRAAVAAVAGALLTLGGGIYSGLSFADVPRSNVVEALERAAGPGPVGTLPSLRIALYEFYSEHAAQFLIAAAISALGAFAIAGALTFLAYATAARRPEFPRAALYVPVVGGVLLGVALVIVAIGTDGLVDDALGSRRTVDAVSDLGSNSLLVAGQLIEIVGRFTLGAAFVLVCLNAMRVGLLSRFMGVLGIIAGVLLALPIFGGPLPVVQVFWLGALGVLFSGLWPGGLPPAWQTGKAEPWPSAAEARAQRDQARGREAPPEPELPAAAGEHPHPASKKKKRKRRN